MTNAFLLCGLLLALKHFLADGPLQLPYMYLNKGKFGHPGGLVHAYIHGAFATLIFSMTDFWWLGLVDAVIHYFVDLAKVKLTARYRWSGMETSSTKLVDGFGVTIPPHLAIYSDWYFYALIADQCLHFATYIVLLWIAFS